MESPKLRRHRQRGSRLLGRAFWCAFVAVQLGATAAAGRGLTYVEGPGFRLTPSSVLHPAAGVELGYDSNLGYSDEAVGAGFLRLMLRADYASRPPQRLPGVGVSAARQMIDFRLGLSVERRDYLSTSADARALSSWQFDEAARLTINPQGTFGGGASAQYSRSLLPRNFEPLGAYMRDVVLVGAATFYRTKHTRMELGLTYDFAADWFESDELRYANTLRHLVRLTARKELVYRLGLALEVAVGHFGHPEVQTVLQKADSTPLTVALGLTGIIRPRLTGTLKLGYVNGFYEHVPNLKNENLSRPLVEAEATWQVVPFTARLSGGYGYQPQDAIFGNFYVDNLVYLRYDHLLAVPRFRAFLVSVRPAYRYRTYHGQPLGYEDRADSIVQVQVLVDLPLKDWLLVGVGYDLSADFTGFRAPSGIPGVPGIPYAYVKHEAFLKTQVAY